MKFTSIEQKDRKIPLILKLDIGGVPVRWIHWQDAIVAEFTGKVKWRLGENKIKLMGGTNAYGLQSEFELSPIIAVNDHASQKRMRKVPLLTNSILFRRDCHMCLYCGTTGTSQKLTRDHIQPRSKGGPDIWTNVVACCKGCNLKKADRTPEQAGMQLLAVPFTPNNYEHLILQNRRIVADQMDFLIKGVSKNFKAQHA